MLVNVKLDCCAHDNLEDDGQGLICKDCGEHVASKYPRQDSAQSEEWRDGQD